MKTVYSAPNISLGELKRIGGRVLVPTAIFKAIYDPNRQEAGAYVVGNFPGALPQVVSVAGLNKMAGLDMFPSVSAQVKDRAMRPPIPKPRKKRDN